MTGYQPPSTDSNSSTIVSLMVYDDGSGHNGAFAVTDSVAGPWAF